MLLVSFLDPHLKILASSCVPVKLQGKILTQYEKPQICCILLTVNPINLSQDESWQTQILDGMYSLARNDLM